MVAVWCIGFQESINLYLIQANFNKAGEVKPLARQYRNSNRILTNLFAPFWQPLNAFKCSVARKSILSLLELRLVVVLPCYRFSSFPVSDWYDCVCIWWGAKVVYHHSHLLSVRVGQVWVASNVREIASESLSPEDANQEVTRVDSQVCMIVSICVFDLHK